MKRLAFAASVLFVAGCSGDIPALRTSMAEVTVDQFTLQTTFNVDANKNWTLSFDDSAAEEWCSASPMSGSGFKVTTVTVTAQENSDTVRKATLTVTAGGVATKVAVTQGLGLVAYFEATSGKFTVNGVSGTSPAPTFDITLTTPYPVSYDRTVTLSVSCPDAARGALYDYASPQVVIAADQTTATFTIQGYYDGFDTLNEATLSVEIIGGDFTPVRFNQVYTLTIAKGTPPPAE